MNPSWKTWFRILSELPQPSKAGQYSSPGNTENTAKIFLKKSNSKAHNHQIHQGRNEGKNAKGSQRERPSYPQRKAHQTQWISWQKPYKPEESGNQYSTSLISYPAKLNFISKGEIKSFTNKQLLRDFVTTRPTLQELLKEALNIERNNQYQPLWKHTKW